MESRDTDDPRIVQSIIPLIRMNYELDRLNSFKDVWPLTYISPNDLAGVGFFYLQISDKVQCAYCKLILMNWKPGDLPFIEHINKSPSCPFILRQDVGNVGLGNDVCGSKLPEYSTNDRGAVDSSIQNARLGIVHLCNDVCGSSKSIERRAIKRVQNARLNELGVNIHKGPYYPSYVTESARLRSFKHWPKIDILKPDVLANAGFFYVGIMDRVACFYCGGELFEWEKNDDPWVDHACWFSDCSFVTLNKSKEFIQSSLEKKSRHTGVSDQLAIQSTTSSTTIDETVESFIQSNMVQAFLKINSDPLSLVRAAILHKLNMTGTVVHNIDELCDAIHTFKTGNSGTLPSTINNDKVVHGENAQSHSSTHCDSEPKSSEMFNLESLKVEIRRLREQNICKICLDREVSITFLPCGHFISCIQCAIALTKCALCRRKINGTVKTFLS